MVWCVVGVLSYREQQLCEECIHHTLRMRPRPEARFVAKAITFVPIWPRIGHYILEALRPHAAILNMLVICMTRA